MNLLTIKNLTKSYTEKVLFSGIDFGLEEGEKVGVIGINGTGKSTFLKVVAGLEDYDSGEYVKGRNVVINYLPQNPDFDSELSIYDYVYGLNESANSSNSIEGEVKSMLNRLGFDDFSVRIATLSGGQKKKVALAAALMSKNEILILDEPTNHLDNAMIEWLEKWLREYRGTLIMVTHDRYFLDLACNRIVELDKGKLYSYDTNYEGFLQLKAEREAMALSTQAKHQNILRKEIAWMQRGARARSTKQKAHIKRYEALRDEEKVQIDEQAKISSISQRLGKKTIELNSISKAYGDKKLINSFTYNFLKDDRVGILGPNGCGKSTLVKMITGSVIPDSGNVEIGDTVKIGYYAQEPVGMNPEQKVIDYIKDTAEYIRTEDGGYISASQMLENFLFVGSLQYQKIEKLSGGERRRLYLAKVLMEAPNVLILDEPTNDLDIQTLCILEDYLDTFPGILITVSHDRYFLDRTVRRMLTFEGNGQIVLFNCSYTDYYESHRELFDFETGKSVKNTESALDYKKQKEQNKKLKFTYNEKREYETIEADIETLELKIAEVEEKLLDRQIASNYQKLTELEEQKQKLKEELDTKYERFLYLEELNEAINNQ